MSSSIDAENSRFMGDVDAGLLRGGVDADADDAKRSRVLVMLEKLTLHFVHREAPRIGANHTWALVKSFGSSAIGGHLAGGDLDVCAIVPSYIPRVNFFEEYPKLLGEFSSVSDIVAVVDARVQLLKFRMHGFEIDMVLATLNATEPPTDDELMDVTIFDRAGPESRISLNGIRTALVFQSMMKKADADVFSVVLKAVKTWAKARRIYGHNFAFISSVGFAVLVLLVVLERPKDCAVALFRQFFATYAARFKAALSDTSRTPDPISLVTNLNPYPQYYRRWQGLPDTWEQDRSCHGLSAVEPLVVINPAYPYVNSCYTTCITAFYIFATELEKAHQYLTAGSPTDRYPWRRLVDPTYDMSRDYSDFVVVTVSSQSGEGFAEYCGFVESKVKCLWYAAEASGLDCRLLNSRLPNPVAPADVERSSLFVLGVRPTAQLPSTAPAYSEAIQSAIAEFQFAVSTVPTDTMSRAQKALPVTASVLLSDNTDKEALALREALCGLLGANHGAAQLDELAASPIRRHRSEI